MGIADIMARSPSHGLFPSATPAMNSQQVAATRNINVETLQKQLEYGETLKDLDNRRLERDAKRRKLEFDLAHQDELMEAGYEVDKLQLEDPILDDIARDVPFIKDEESWGIFLQKHGKHLQNIPELHNQDGKPKSFREALPLINDFRKQRMYTVGHQQALELAQMRAAGMNPQMPAPKIDGRQLDSARTVTDKFIEDTGFDLGGDSESSDRRRLEYTVAYITQQVNQARADKGKKTNEDQVRSKVLALAKTWTKDHRFNIPMLNKKVNLPLHQDTEIDWEGLNKDINSEFGIDVPTQEGGQSVSGPAAFTVPQFDSEEEAAAAGLKPGTKVMINGIPGTWN